MDTKTDYKFAKLKRSRRRKGERLTMASNWQASRCNQLWIIIVVSDRIQLLVTSYQLQPQVKSIRQSPASRDCSNKKIQRKIFVNHSQHSALSQSFTHTHTFVHSLSARFRANRAKQSNKQINRNHTATTTTTATSLCHIKRLEEEEAPAETAEYVKYLEMCVMKTKTKKRKCFKGKVNNGTVSESLSLSTAAVRLGFAYLCRSLPPSFPLPCHIKYSVSVQVSTRLRVSDGYTSSQYAWGVKNENSEKHQDRRSTIKNKKT